MMTPSPPGTLTGKMWTGAASTASTQPAASGHPAAEAASVPTRSRWVVGTPEQPPAPRP